MASEIFRQSRKSVSNHSKIFVKKSFSIIEYIVFLLEQKNMTVIDLAEKINVSEEEIRKILSPGYNMTFKTIAKIEDALGESIIVIPTPNETAPIEKEKQLQTQVK